MLFAIFFMSKLTQFYVHFCNVTQNSNEADITLILLKVEQYFIDTWLNKGDEKTSKQTVPNPSTSPVLPLTCVACFRCCK